MKQKQCMICTTFYDYCPDCERINSYRAITDKPLCYALYIIAIEHRDKIIDDKKALEKLKELNITKENIDNFSLRENVKQRFLNIISSEVDFKTVSGSPSETIVQNYKQLRNKKRRK